MPLKPSVMPHPPTARHPRPPRTREAFGVARGGPSSAWISADGVVEPPGTPRRVPVGGDGHSSTRPPDTCGCTRRKPGAGSRGPAPRAAQIRRRAHLGGRAGSRRRATLRFMRSQDPDAVHVLALVAPRQVSGRGRSRRARRASEPPPARRARGTTDSEAAARWESPPADPIRSRRSAGWSTGSASSGRVCTGASVGGRRPGPRARRSGRYIGDLCASVDAARSCGMKRSQVELALKIRT